MEKKPYKKKSRADYERNRVEIQMAYINFIKRNGRRPWFTELTKETKLHYNTVRKHMLDIQAQDLGNLEKSNLADLKILTPEILLGLASKAMKGNSACAKLFLQVVEGWTEPGQSVDITSKGEKLTGAMAPIVLGNPLKKIKKEQEN